MPSGAEKGKRPQQGKSKEVGLKAAPMLKCQADAEQETASLTALRKQLDLRLLALKGGGGLETIQWRSHSPGEN